MVKKNKNFIRSQLSQISSGGLPVLLWKLWVVFLFILAVPTIFLIRLLRPFVTLRFSPLPSSRIGHFAAHTEIYLCQRDKGMHDPRTIDLFYYITPFCNYQLKKMWDRSNLRIATFVKMLDRINDLIPGKERHIVPLPTERDVHNLIVTTPAHISFNKKEEELGQKECRRIGISNGSAHICFHARDSLYLDTLISSQRWDYHDFRNSDIASYLSAAEELAGRGYYMIRMGAVVKDQLSSKNKQIIDYATKYRTDFLDIYLAATCRFFICSLSGISEIAKIFRRPVAWVNSIPIAHLHSWDPMDISIPKKLWLRRERRFLSFPEIFNSDVGTIFDSQEYDRRGIDIIDNTPEEIRDLALEMEGRLNGSWKSSSDDEKLQQKFWSQVKPGELHGKVSARIGTKFLKQNRNLLE